MARVGAGFTTRASCLIAAGATAVLCGLLLGEVDLVRVGVLALALPVVSALVVYRSRVRIANRRSADPARASVGNPIGIHLTITNRSVLPTGALMLQDRLPAQLTGHARFVIDGLAGKEARTVSYRLPALPRGRYRAGPLQIRLTDPFHMIDITRSFTATTDFVVAPVVDPLPLLEPPRSYDIGDNAGSHSVGIRGADDASTREYRTGDDLRKIHWRSSARTGNLMVRQEERPWQGQTTVLVDLRARAHGTAPRRDDSAAVDVRERSSLEWAISAAASIGTHVIMAGRELSLLCDLRRGERMHPANAVMLTDYLAGLLADPRANLTPLAAASRIAARDSALVAILGELDPDSLRMLADAHPRGSAVPAFALLLETSTWTVSQPSARVSPSCRAAADVLRAAGWRVVTVRRGDGTPSAWISLLQARTGTARLEAMPR